MKYLFKIIGFVVCTGLFLIHSGKAYGQAKFGIDKDTVSVLMYNPEQAEVQVISIDNKEGKSDLTYQLSIDYKRTKNTISHKGIRDSTENKGFSKVLQYVKETALNDNYGTGEGQETILATKFNAGPGGINISDVGTWFAAKEFSQGTIRLEIRAGGTSIDDAFVLATGKLDYVIGGNEVKGKMRQITLDKKAAIYPNEDFYVIFTYPPSTVSPQGCVKNENVVKVEGRYLVKMGKLWVDVQNLDGKSNFAWIMYVAEKTPMNIGWLKIQQGQSATIQPGGNSLVMLQIWGAHTVPGDQLADLTFKTNDPENPVIKVPLTLRINEAPCFVNAPTELHVAENRTTSIKIDLVDYENDSIMIKKLEGCEIVHDTITETQLILTIDPSLGDTSFYTVKYKATDEYGANRELEIAIHIGYKNMAPVYSGDSSIFVYSFREKMIEYSIKDLFSDPDGDTFTFTVTSKNPAIADVFSTNDNLFVVKPKTVGETILDFMVTDIHNLTTRHSIRVVVGLCVNPAGIVVQKWNNVLLVNNNGNKYKSDGYQWYKKGEPIPEATGQYYSAGNRESDMLDFTTEYYVRLVTENNDTVYTCPMIPIMESRSLKAYPNPVLRGSTLTVETEQTNLHNYSETTVRIVSLSGKVIKTVSAKERIIHLQMPSNQGIYIVKISSGKEDKTFNILVE